MKLSEAILLGSIGTSQAFGYYELDGMTCAMGAALTAVGKLHKGPKMYHANFHEEIVTWPWLAQRMKCPMCAGEDLARNVIAHLNNEHRWTRPEIAYWVKGIEAQFDAPQPNEQVVQQAHVTS